MLHPVLSSLLVSPSTFSLGGRQVKGSCVKPTKKNNRSRHCRLPVRLRVSYRLNLAAPVTITLKHEVAGRKLGRRCVTPTKKNGKHPKCTLLVNLPGRITLAGRSGANHFTFNGKIGGHNLGPGMYQLIASPTVTGGTPRKVTFTIVA